MVPRALADRRPDRQGPRRRPPAAAWSTATSSRKTASVITRDDNPDFIKVLDFGLAKVLSGHRHQNAWTVGGSPGYIAPEIYRGGKHRPPRRHLRPRRRPPHAPASAASPPRPPSDVELPPGAPSPCTSPTSPSRTARHPRPKPPHEDPDPALQPTAEALVADARVRPAPPSPHRDLPSRSSPKDPHRRRWPLALAAAITIVTASSLLASCRRDHDPPVDRRSRNRTASEQPDPVPVTRPEPSKPVSSRHLSRADETCLFRHRRVEPTKSSADPQPDLEQVLPHADPHARPEQICPFGHPAARSPRRLRRARPPPFDESAAHAPPCKRTPDRPPAPPARPTRASASVETTLVRLRRQRHRQPARQGDRHPRHAAGLRHQRRASSAWSPACSFKPSDDRRHLRPHSSCCDQSGAGCHPHARQLNIELLLCDPAAGVFAVPLRGIPWTAAISALVHLVPVAQLQAGSACRAAACAAPSPAGPASTCADTLLARRG